MLRRALPYVLAIAFLVGGGLGAALEQYRPSTPRQDVIAADTSPLRVDDEWRPTVHVIENASLPELLAVLSHLEPGYLSLIGYVDADGRAQALTHADLACAPEPSLHSR